MQLLSFVCTVAVALYLVTVQDRVDKEADARRLVLEGTRDTRVGLVPPADVHGAAATMEAEMGPDNIVGDADEAELMPTRDREVSRREYSNSTGATPSRLSDADLEGWEVIVFDAEQARSGGAWWN
ncbi:hypothetical protein BV25DRAFT_1914853 [Artomyces pyxidatus]|uniref:Uncharacterized protein n=1 Tax=Artomyces pyxidatus TaxID=48021 RepID=A0ACB8T4S8_9AGAM|nr:hypothetical protein BV25DRAFT_1914853 [Artomyces pyxidatus]